jgi:predicted metal-binding protein
MPSIEIKYEEIFFDPKVQTMCVSPSFTCPHYNHSHSCPPSAPYLEQELSNYRKYYLIYSRFNLSEYVKEQKIKHPKRSEQRIKYFFYMNNLYKEDLKEEVEKFLSDYNGKSEEMLLLYDGTCRICLNDRDNGCTFDSGKLCRYPDKQMFSMEAIGIEVIRTAAKLPNRDFEYPSKTYSYRFGLVCIK